MFNNSRIWNMEKLNCFCDDEEALKTILKIFAEESKQSLSLIKKGCTEKDFNQISTTVHSLKSMSGGVGAEKLFELSRDVELLSKCNNKKVFSLIDHLTDAHNELMTTIDSYLT